jgi:hypothetical protein
VWEALWVLEERNIVQTVTGSIVENIQVAGTRNFDGKRWREAILSYLFGIWRNDEFITGRPKIMFGGDVTLRLMEDSYYILYGTSRESLASAPVVEGEVITTNGGERNQMEVSLIRFVKNNQVRRLCIFLGHNGSLVLSKGSSRGELIAWATHLPTTEEMVKRYYQR